MVIYYHIWYNHRAHLLYSCARCKHSIHYLWCNSIITHSVWMLALSRTELWIFTIDPLFLVVYNNITGPHSKFIVNLWFTNSWTAYIVIYLYNTTEYNLNSPNDSNFSLKQDRSMNCYQSDAIITLLGMNSTFYKKLNLENKMSASIKNFILWN